MATSAWPAGVPNEFDQGSFDEDAPDPFRRTKNQEELIFKSRRIAVTSFAFSSGRITMSRVQAVSLIGFYETSGGEDFDGLRHPLTHSLTNIWFFANAPKFSNVGYDLWAISLQLARIT
jgi:hypothetical protein